MIRVIDVASKTRTPVPEGNVTTVLGPSDEGTRVQVVIREVESGKTCRVGPSDRTQVVYILDGTGATVTYTKAGTTTQRTTDRRAGVYLEPSEEATVIATGTALVLLLVSLTKILGRPISDNEDEAC